MYLLMYLFMYLLMYLLMWLPGYSQGGMGHSSTVWDASFRWVPASREVLAELLARLQGIYWIACIGICWIPRRGLNCIAYRGRCWITYRGIWWIVYWGIWWIVKPPTGLHAKLACRRASTMQRELCPHDKAHARSQ